MEITNNINDFISNLILVDNNKRAQIINFVLENVDDRFAKALVKIYSRIVGKLLNLKEILNYLIVELRK